MQASFPLILKHYYANANVLQHALTSNSLQRHHKSDRDDHPSHANVYQIFYYWYNSLCDEICHSLVSFCFSLVQFCVLN
jgi:hypothetical protein